MSTSRSIALVAVSLFSTIVLQAGAQTSSPKSPYNDGVAHAQAAAPSGPVDPLSMK